MARGSNLLVGLKPVSKYLLVRGVIRLAENKVKLAVVARQ